VVNSSTKLFHEKRRAKMKRNFIFSFSGGDFFSSKYDLKIADFVQNGTCLR